MCAAEEISEPFWGFGEGGLYGVEDEGMESSSIERW